MGWTVPTFGITVPGVRTTPMGEAIRDGDYDSRTRPRKVLVAGARRRRAGPAAAAQEAGQRQAAGVLRRPAAVPDRDGACGSAHHWARELIKLGHEVRLIPPQYVKPYVKGNKHDAADAEAICEAVTRPSMRFVPVKTVEQQTMAQLHRIRQLLVKQRTMQ